jgi:hypothetical protein
MNVAAPTYLEWMACVNHYEGNEAVEERTAHEKRKRFRHDRPTILALFRLYASKNDP